MVVMSRLTAQPMERLSLKYNTHGGNPDKGASIQPYPFINHVWPLALCTCGFERYHFDL